MPLGIKPSQHQQTGNSRANSLTLAQVRENTTPRPKVWIVSIRPGVPPLRHALTNWGGDAPADGPGLGQSKWAAGDQPRGHTRLVVDDNALVREALTILLEAHGASVTSAGSAADDGCREDGGGLGAAPPARVMASDRLPNFGSELSLEH